MQRRSRGVLAVLRATLNSFWVCRVSIVSCLAGLLLFYGAPQAQAVFFDLHTWESGLWHWATFYASVFLFWMLPTQLGARIMLLSAEDRFQEGHTSWYAILVVHLPWFLALTCLASVAAGQYWAFDHIPDVGTRSDLETAAYNQLKFLLGATVAFMCLWLLCSIILARAMFGWRVIARLRRVDTAEPEGKGSKTISAQQLRTVLAGVWLLGIWALSLYLVNHSQPLLSRAPMIPILVGTWVPALTVFAYMGNRSRLPILTAVILALTFVADTLPGVHAVRVILQTSQDVPLQSRQASLEEALISWRIANDCLGQLNDTTCTKRPIIVAAEGGASRAAFFTGSVLAHLEDLSDPAPSRAEAPVFSRRLFAISTVSGSSLGAAVFAALRDDHPTAPLPPIRQEAPSETLWFKSGENLELAGLKATVKLPYTDTRKDLVQLMLAGDFLTPAIFGLNLDIWAPFLTLRLGDRTFKLEQSWEQRFAAMLSDTSFTGAVGRGFDRPFSSLAPAADHWRPLLVFNGTSVETGRRIITSTLHPLIGTGNSDGTGFEPVFRDAYDTYDLMCYVHPGSKANNGTCSCTDITAYHELKEPRVKGCDVRLSTAVSNSARFPIISSPGDINGADSKLVDRVVDGGYFDYSGLVTALELRQQMSRIDVLDPFVLFITNDPGFDPQACTEKSRSDDLQVLRRSPTPPPPAAWELFSILRYPLDTVLNARVGRSEQTTSEADLSNTYEKKLRILLKTALGSPGQEANHFDVISIGARCNSEKQIRPIAMNWWLHMPAQDYLDEQICSPHNMVTTNVILSLLYENPADQDAASTRSRSYCVNRAGNPRRAMRSR
jgi:hypothetical protein